MICIICLPLYGCFLFLPTKKNTASDISTCELSVPEWQLTVQMFDDFDACHGASGHDAEACLLALGVVIPVGSLLVSGSVVVLGNSIRWLEYQGRCDDSAINKGLALLKTDLGENGQGTNEFDEDEE